MTTKVQIINYGPDPVEVRGIHPDTGDIQHMTLVNPGETSSVAYVHKDVVIVVEEFKP